MHAGASGTYNAFFFASHLPYNMSSLWSTTTVDLLGMRLVPDRYDTSRRLGRVGLAEYLFDVVHISVHVFFEVGGVYQMIYIQ